MYSTLKRCLPVLVFFLFSPVSGHSHSPDDDSGAVQLLVVVVIVILVLLGLVLYRCIKENIETNREVRLEPLEPPFRADDRNAPIQIYAVAGGRAENDFRHFGGYGNEVPYQRRE